MGWCSATDIFDSVIDTLRLNDVDSSVIEAVAEVLAVELEDKDWDCQCESSYYDHPVIGRILGNEFEEEE